MVELSEDKGEFGQVKIIDFGFANYLSKLQGLSPKELWVGTPNYISPEIIRGEGITEKSDNFAIGSILYFMYKFVYLDCQGPCPLIAMIFTAS